MKTIGKAGMPKTIDFCPWNLNNVRIVLKRAFIVSLMMETHMM